MDIEWKTNCSPKSSSNQQVVSRSKLCVQFQISRFLRSPTIYKHKLQHSTPPTWTLNCEFQHSRPNLHKSRKPWSGSPCSRWMVGDFRSQIESVLYVNGQMTGVGVEDFPPPVSLPPFPFIKRDNNGKRENNLQLSQLALRATFLRKGL